MSYGKECLSAQEFIRCQIVFQNTGFIAFDL